VTGSPVGTTTARSLAEVRTFPFGPGAVWTLAALAIYVAAATRMLSLDAARLLVVVPDDAFYYLEIARNLASDGWSTFDRVASTNGYHPLWMGVLTLLALAVDDRETLFRVALATSFLLNGAVAVAIGSVMRRLVDPRWAATAGICWLLNPLAFTIALTGTEAVLTVLGTLLVVLSFAPVFDALRAVGAPSTRQLVTFGAALGLLCLARTDGVILGALGITWVTVATWRRSRRPGAGLRAALVTGLAAAAMLAPWWVFSALQVGTVSQDSGAMKMLWAADRYPEPWSRVLNLRLTIAFFSRRCLSLMTVWNFSWWSFAPAAAALAVGPAIVLVRHRRSLRATVQVGLLLAVVVSTLVYGLLMVDRQVWWLALPCLTFFLVSFSSFPAVLDALPAARVVHPWARMGVVLLSVALIARWHIKDYKPYPWQPDVMRSQLALADYVPEDERIGVFNAGIPAFFGRHPVVALDGLVNTEARRCWEARRVDAYVAWLGLRYVVDEELALARAQRFSGRPIPIEEVTTFELSSWPSGRRVLWRVSTGEVTAAPAGSSSLSRTDRRRPGSAPPCRAVS
jgi:hypothetical protein